MPVKCEVCTAAMNEWEIGHGNILYRCPECGHIRRDLTVCRAGARDHAYGGSESYDRLRNTLTFKRMMRLLKKHRIDPRVVFELGFGGGLILRKFLDKGMDVSGVERNMLEIEIDADVRKRGTLYFAEAEKFEFPPDSFDLVYGIHLVEHLDDPSKVFDGSYRALRNRGMIYLITPAGDSTGLRRYGDAWWNLEDPTHLRFFSEDSITRALGKAGFKRVIVRRPIWDSMTLEINSLLRRKKHDEKKGVLNGKLSPLVHLALLPWALSARALFPKFRSSLEVVAFKE